MHFRWFVFWIVIVALLLVGMGAYYIFHCEHQWQAPTCEEAELCVLCGRLRGKALGHDWQAATCQRAESCSRCSSLQGEALGHEYSKATCTADSVCSRCGTVGEQALGHDWQDANCLEPKTCLRCGEHQEGLASHQWQDATCDRAQICSLCSAEQGESLGHDWKEADCLAPKTCLRCAESEGELAPHQWQAATCLTPETCSVCKQTRGETGAHRFEKASCVSPAKCSVCSLSQGEPLGHDWKEATCSAARTCSRCGATDGAPLGHAYAQDGEASSRSCTRCGQVVQRKYVALTFDDGPSGQVTTTLLEGLRQRGVKVTFFLCGYRIKIYPQLPQSILDGGHEIGLHTNNHQTLTKLSKEGIRQELEGMLGLLPADCKVSLMRPPGGAQNAAVREVCSQLGLSLIMWGVDPEDWATGDSSTVSNRVVNAAYDGSIILLHDLRSSSVQGALDAIDRLQGQGYEFVTVSELAAIKGHSLQAGSVYYSFR